MIDEHDEDTQDWVQELNFRDDQESNKDNECKGLCPCCRMHDISDEQEQAQVEGEICTVCNFYEWEQL